MRRPVSLLNHRTSLGRFIERGELNEEKKIESASSNRRERGDRQEMERQSVVKERKKKEKR